MVDKELMSIEEAAALLDVSESTARRLFDEGEITGIRTRPGPGGHRRPYRGSVLGYRAKQRGEAPPESAPPR